MLSRYELENLSRSAAMAPLARRDVEAVIQKRMQLQRERERIVAIIAGLPSTCAALKDARTPSITLSADRRQHRQAQR